MNSRTMFTKDIKKTNKVNTNRESNTRTYEQGWASSYLVANVKSENELNLKVLR